MDESAVHPEAYGVVEKMATDLGLELKLLIGKEDQIKKVDARKYVTESEIGRAHV